MKTKNVLFVCALVLIFVAGYSIEASAQCSNATLFGTYIYSSIGTLAPGTPGSPLYLETGMETYDGAGHVKNVYTSSGGSGTETATYSINHDCIGKVTYGTPATDIYTIYVNPAGDSFTYTKTGGSDPQSESGTENRVSHNLLTLPTS